MKIKVTINDALLHEALNLSGAKTKKAVISMALEEFVASRKRTNLLELEGKISFRDDYDYKASREGMLPASQ